MNHPMSTRTLATATLAALTTFPILVLALHVIQADSYDPAVQAVSELALGRAGWLMAVAFCAAGLGMLGFAALLRRILPGAVVIPALVVGSGLATFVSAFVHADGETDSTVHGQVHQAMGLISIALVVVAMFACIPRFRREPAWRSFARPTLAWAVSAVGAFMLVPALGPDRFGVAQRIFFLVWLSWPIVVVARARSGAARIESPGPALSPAHG
jgi:hypothetical protein